MEGAMSVMRVAGPAHESELQQSAPGGPPVGAANGSAPLAPFHPVGGMGWALIQMGFAAAMTLGHFVSYANPWVVLLLVPVSGVVAAMPLSARWHRTWLGKMCLLLWVPLIWVVGDQLHQPVPELSALWPGISALLVLGLVAMSGAPRVAWAMTLLVTVACILWARSRGLPAAAGLEQVAILTPVVGGTVYREVMRRARDREVVAREQEAAAILRLGMLASQAEARREYRIRMLAQVGSLLERIGEGEPLSAAERTECRLMEASLRDAIRGRGLATREVAQAARAARERGATVTLIDDRLVECADEVGRNVRGATKETLDLAQTGDTCVARLLPTGRRNVATVLLVKGDGEGVRREFALPPSGNPADGALERPRVSLTA